MGGYLSDVRVVDVTMNMSGPFATQTLAEQGADVIKIEPPNGDPMRQVGSGRPGMSGYFANLNRGKRSLCIDLTDPSGVDAVRRLANNAHVFVQNLRPGVAERLGIGPNDILAAAPEIVYVSINGYGRSGPLSDRPAYDHVVQALSGYADLQRSSEDAPPELVRHGLIDKATGLVVAEAVVAALLAKTRARPVDPIEVSMLDVAIAFMWPDGMMDCTCLDPVDEAPSIHKSFRVTPTADGYITIVAVTDQQWTGLLKALDLAPATTPDSATQRHRDRTVMRVARDAIGRLRTQDVLERMTLHDVPCAEVVGRNMLQHHPQVVASGTLVRRHHPVLGTILQPRPIVVGGSVEPSPAPALGQDNAAVLADAGLNTDEIASLTLNGTTQSNRRIQ